MCVATYPDRHVETPPLEEEDFPVVERRWLNEKFEPGFDVATPDGIKQYICIPCPRRNDGRY